MTMSNGLIRYLPSIIDSLVVEKTVLANEAIALLYWKTYLKSYKVTTYYGTCLEYI